MAVTKVKYTNSDINSGNAINLYTSDITFTQSIFVPTPDKIYPTGGSSLTNKPEGQWMGKAAAIITVECKIGTTAESGDSNALSFDGVCTGLRRFDETSSKGTLTDEKLGSFTVYVKDIEVNRNADRGTGGDILNCTIVFVETS